MSHITALTLIETIDDLEKGKFSERELKQAYLQRVGKIDPLINSALWVNDHPGGIPASIKDVYVTKGIPTTAGSKILEGFVPPYDATAISRLKEHRVGVLSKANLDEFAMGSSGENSAYGPTKNPWDLSKVPGGSSSGSAAAVAADLCVFSLGTDTGGSIRLPASLTGVVGLKPSYGRVSRYGVIAMTSSLDCPGPITKSVADTRLVLEWISGEDGYDSNCTQEGFKNKGLRMKDNLKGLKVGVPREYFGKGLDPEVGKVVKTAIQKLEKMGAKTVEISLSHTQDAIATYYIIVFSEVSSNMARFDGIRFGQSRESFGEEVKRRIMLGTFALSAGYYEEYYHQAAKVRTLIQRDFQKVFEKCDVIVGPVSPTVAWRLGEKVDDPLKMYLSDIYCVPANLAGIPALSVPCGFVNGLPVGLQILGPYLREDLILNIGEIYEQATDWRKEKPKL